jgi:hypothetical protein
MLEIGNVGVITTFNETTLFEITGIRNGLIYCVTLNHPKKGAICLPDQFWVLLESF